MASITLTIDDENLDEFKIGFLKQCPVPLGADNEPLYAENEWLKEAGRRFYVNTYAIGKTNLAIDEANDSINEDIVT